MIQSTLWTLRGFTAGLIVGVFFGVMIMACLNYARSGDDETNERC